MERKPYSAGAVKFSFWFMEFRKTVQLLSEGKSFADIKKLNEETNIYGAPTKLRAQQIYSTVTARIKTLDESFYPIFLSSDLATQKLFVLTAALLHDTLFFDFVYTPENAVVFLTGIGKCYPILRSHKVLNNLHQAFVRCPVVMFFPGTYNEQELILFNEIKDDNYYRAFRLVK